MNFAGVINALAEHLNSAVFVLLIVLAVSYWAVYKVTQITTRWRDRENTLKEFREDWRRDIPPLRARVDLSENTLKEFRDNWQRDIPPLRARVDLIFQHLFPNSAIKTDSPVRLTDVGRNISEALAAESIVATHLEKFRDFVNQANPQTAYDMQQICFAVIENHLTRLLSPEQLNIAKDKALEYGIPLDNALAVVGVALRDKLLAEKGWAVGDVDKHAPTR